MTRNRVKQTILAGIFLGSAVGCLETDEARVTMGDVDGSAARGLIDAGEPLPVLADGGIVDTPVAKLDVLFVIDNSGSMASKQARLMHEVSRMIAIFTSGDRSAQSGNTAVRSDDKTRDFTPVSSLHLGVVSSNAGGIDAPPGQQTAILACAGNGDDGKLQRSTTIAQNGVIALPHEFNLFAEGDVVIAPDPSCALPPQPAYQSFVTADDPAKISHDLLCVSKLGVRGCPFEQPLESMWKALAPSSPSSNDPLYTFLNGSRGQGDAANQGFLREDAVLAVVILSDEDDCTITEEGKVMFVTGGPYGEEANQLYGPLNLRCGLNADKTALVQPVDRFVSGLRSLKPGHPERIVVTEIVGVPTRAIESGLSYDEVLQLPEMQFRENPLSPGFPIASCSGIGMSGLEESSYGGRRYIELAKQLGSQAVVESICADSYRGAVDRMIAKVAPVIGAK